MAEMVGCSRDLPRRNGAIGGLIAALKQAFSGLTGRSRSSNLRLEEWPEYLLRDIGLDRTIRDETDPRARQSDWLIR